MKYERLFSRWDGRAVSTCSEPQTDRPVDSVNCSLFAYFLLTFRNPVGLSCPWAENEDVKIAPSEPRTSSSAASPTDLLNVPADVSA